MKKHLAYYETEWPANIAELTAVENKPFVGYLGGTKEVKYTVIPAPVEGPANNEIWYTSIDGNVVTPYETGAFGSNIVDNSYKNGKGVITFDGDVTLIGLLAFQSCSSLTSINIPNSVTIIVDAAFSNCSGLTTITIPDSVTSIGSSAFANCSSLTSITIPSGVVSLNYDVFRNCYSLTSVTIGKSVKSIGELAFWECSSLTSITIPESVTWIGRSAFENCWDLTSVIYEGTQEQWNNVSKDEGWNNSIRATYVQCTDGQVPLQ